MNPVSCISFHAVSPSLSQQPFLKRAKYTLFSSYQNVQRDGHFKWKAISKTISELIWKQMLIMHSNGPYYYLSSIRNTFIGALQKWLSIRANSIIMYIYGFPLYFNHFPFKYIGKRNASTTHGIQMQERNAFFRLMLAFASMSPLLLLFLLKRKIALFY